MTILRIYRPPFALLMFMLVAAGVLSGFAATSWAQPAPERGPRHVDPRWHALVGATVIPEPGKRIDNATIVVRDGLIRSVRAGGAAPAGARVHDCTGLLIYPAFLEPHLPVETPAPPADARDTHPHPDRVMPQRSALDGGGPDANTREALRKLGFAAAAIVPDDGNIRGTAAVVSLAEPIDNSQGGIGDVLADPVYQEVSFASARRRFNPGGPRRATYPTSAMGAIALVRQALADAEWHADCAEAYERAPDRHEPPAPGAVAALGTGGRGSAPLLFHSSNEIDLLRGAALADEFQREMILLGSGREYRRLAAVVATGMPLIVPLGFPEVPDVSTFAAADRVDLRTLMDWERAPSNPTRLLAAGMDVALTSDRLDARNEFHDHLATAIEHGLDPNDALAMLTTTPARMLGLEERLGRIAPGMIANLLVTDAPLFDKKTKIREVWASGHRHVVERPDAKRPEGTLQLDHPLLADVRFELVKGKLTAHRRDTEVAATRVRLTADSITFLLAGDEFGAAGIHTFRADIAEQRWRGTSTSPTGEIHNWTASRIDEDDAGDTAPESALADAGTDATATDADTTDADTTDADTTDADTTEAGTTDADTPDAGTADNDSTIAVEAMPDVLPFGAYGLTELPASEHLYIRGATLWTSGPHGTIDGGVLVVRDGRVAYAGPADGAPEIGEARVIDAGGKHITPGLIDCHSHTGLRGGTNEVGERVTAEVRIQDVTNPDDINWYRQLAGGLTAANQLHGSANAIGGQNCVVKLRWGVAHPADMHVADARPGIKFALGENPKRVAAGTEIPDEYPQTRMGVASLIRDRLEAGRQYRADWARYHALSPAARRAARPPRRDLELEALGEIVAGERLIHCHSYRQDEIFMLARLAQEFGFVIGTFQHVLEGYKVAEAVRDSSLGGSTFSDWWAYKFEVIDAIPHNAALMTRVGVVTSINSDSSEHARRLNTEAGKSVKYGGLSPEDALRLVTINPAIQLAIEHRVGSLEPGKDADFAIWSGDPLSYASRCEATYIDGRCYFSLERDAELRASAARERNRLMQKALAAPPPKKPAGGSGGRRGPRDLTDADRERWLRHDQLMRAGLDPTQSLPGECGCAETHGGEQQHLHEAEGNHR